MTCPECREREHLVRVDIVKTVSSERAVEETVTVRCPVCGWEGQYAL